MKKIAIMLLLVTAGAGLHKAAAQSRSPLSVNFNYSIAQPNGSLSDYAGNTSFRGWKAGINYSLNDRFSLGLGFGFNDFYEKTDRMVYPDKGSDISAVQQRTLQVLPIQAVGQYNFAKADAKVIPYGSLGIGAANMNYEKYWGEFVDKSNKWSFLVSPELGINVPFGKYSPVMFNASVQYNYAPYNFSEISGFNSLQGNIGIKVHIH
ncbi:porin family protein [Chitinophaga horti]|uniref:Porin family protein n=1 Tax=Chitinophaga horti TaxID=2920382 RepID=A0ABY6J6X0_9BACT|nr:outer membrane beta-barrel protein [Chitinophaga horti]UYQ94007.1 porin family protein [Chitinophaga horti]